MIASNMLQRKMKKVDLVQTFVMNEQQTLPERYIEPIVSKLVWRLKNTISTFNLNSKHSDSISSGLPKLKDQSKWEILVFRQIEELL